MTAPDLDEVRAELVEIGRKLQELPGDAFAERVTLRQRQMELRAMAAELYASSRTAEQIRQELADLRRMRDDVFDRHLSIGSIGGGGGPGGGGIEVQYVNEVNRTIDEAWDRAKIDRRIHQLEAELARLEK